MKNQKISLMVSTYNFHDDNCCLAGEDLLRWFHSFKACGFYSRKIEPESKPVVGTKSIMFMLSYF